MLGVKGDSVITHLITYVVVEAGAFQLIINYTAS